MKARSGLALVLMLAACGGKSVLGIPGGGGGAPGTTTTGTTTSGSTTGTTPGPCTTHADCPGGLCIFSTGTCAPSCEPDACPTCSPGSVCQGCATSSCPACDDCRAACLPVQPGECDDDDPCPAGQVCLFQQRVCAAACKTDSDCGGFSTCVGCATGSCCGCKDCVSACEGAE